MTPMPRTSDFSRLLKDAMEPESQLMGLGFRGLGCRVQDQIVIATLPDTALSLSGKPQQHGLEAYGMFTIVGLGIAILLS